MKVLARHPHATDAYTEGLVWHEGQLFESCGPSGAGSLRELTLSSAQPVRQKDIRQKGVFPEGLALVGSQLVQLTEKSGFAFKWDTATLASTGQPSIEGTGWGLTFDGQRLIRSDGTDTLYFHAPDSLVQTSKVAVRLAGQPVTQLNELEYANGAIYANVWFSGDIVRIDPATGNVTGVIDALPLVQEMPRRHNHDVLNGIAYVPESGHFLLTGKRWPAIFEVVFEPISTRPPERD